MYDIAEHVRAWLADGRAVTTAQVVETRGFSSRDPGAAAAWVDGGQPVGNVLAGIDVGTVAALTPGLHELTVDDDAARAAGLSCGGTARVLVQQAAAYPADVWDRLVARAPVCLVTQVAGDAAGVTQAFTPVTIRDAPGQVPRLFGRGVSLTTVVESDAGPAAVVALWPVPALVVVGDGLIAQALADQATLLGWTSRITPDTAGAVAAAGELHPSDALVVLSHDRAVDGPTLSAALAGDAGYVGALGARHTQQARAEWLTAHDVPDADQERIHGPAGLDIDAHTPAEIAVSIVAEIIGNRSASTGGALRDRPGPVHVGGVQAPPPRY